MSLISRANRPTANNTVGLDPTKVLVVIDPRALARPVIRTGWAIVLILAVADIALNHYKILPSPLNRSVNLAREDSIGTWFAMFQLIALSTLAWLLYRHAKSRRLPKIVQRSWAILAGLFMYMSMDDVAKTHERLGTLFSDSFSFFPSYGWQVIFGPIFGIAALVLLYVAWRVVNENAAGVWIVVGLALLVAAVGLDFLEGLDGLAASVADSLGVGEQSVSHFQKVIEEAMEMGAITLFIGAFMTQLGSVAGGLSAQLVPPTMTAEAAARLETDQS